MTEKNKGGRPPTGINYKRIQMTSTTLDLTGPQAKALLEGLQPVFNRLNTDTDFSIKKRWFTKYGWDKFNDEIEGLEQYKTNFKEAYEKW